MAQIIIDKLQRKFAHAILATHNELGNETVTLEKEDIVPLCEFLRDDPALKMSMIMDVTCIDWPHREETDEALGRFDVVYHLYSLEKRHRIRLKVPVSGEPPVIDSVVCVWKGANWFEREAFDMYGVIFKNHPDLRRILLYPEFEGYPLRKDYPIDQRQPLVANRQRNTDYGIQGVTGDSITAGNPTIVQIGHPKQVKREVFADSNLQKEPS